MELHPDQTESLDDTTVKGKEEDCNLPDGGEVLTEEKLEEVCGGVFAYPLGRKGQCYVCNTYAKMFLAWRGFMVNGQDMSGRPICGKCAGLNPSSPF